MATRPQRSSSYHGVPFYTYFYIQKYGHKITKIVIFESLEINLLLYSDFAEGPTRLKS